MKTHIKFNLVLIIVYLVAFCIAEFQGATKGKAPQGWG